MKEIFKTKNYSATQLKKRSKIKNDISAWIWALPVIVVLYLMIWRPTVMGAVWSFFKMKGYTPKDL